MDVPGPQNNVEHVIRVRANYGKWKFFWAPSTLRCATPLTLGIPCNAGNYIKGAVSLCFLSTEEPLYHLLLQGPPLPPQRCGRCRRINRPRATADLARPGEPLPQVARPWAMPRCAQR